MSTRSFIAHKVMDKYEGITCHFDGYVEGGVGEVLRNYYLGVDKVSNLISLGNLNNIGADIGNKHDLKWRKDDVCCFWHRDYGEEWGECAPQVFDNVDALVEKATQIGCEYIYIFDEEWLWSEQLDSLIGTFCSFESLADEIAPSEDVQMDASKKSTSYIHEVANMDVLDVAEFARWLRDMANWIEELRDDHGGEFDGKQELHKWVDELLSLR